MHSMIRLQYEIFVLTTQKGLSTRTKVIAHKVVTIDPGFQIRGGDALKKNRAERREARIFFLVFRVKNHDFMPKKSYFFQF